MKSSSLGGTFSGTWHSPLVMPGAQAQKCQAKPDCQYKALAYWAEENGYAFPSVLNITDKKKAKKSPKLQVWKCCMAPELSHILFTPSCKPANCPVVYLPQQTFLPTAAPTDPCWQQLWHKTVSKASQLHITLQSTENERHKRRKSSLHQFSSEVCCNPEKQKSANEFLWSQCF